MFMGNLVRRNAGIIGFTTFKSLLSKYCVYTLHAFKSVMWYKAAFVFVTFNKVVPPNIFSFLLPGTALYYYRLTKLEGEET